MTKNSVTHQLVQTKDLKFTLSECMRPLPGDSVTPHFYLETTVKDYDLS